MRAAAPFRQMTPLPLFPAMDEKEARGFVPKVVMVDGENHILRERGTEKERETV